MGKKILISFAGFSVLFALLSSCRETQEKGTCGKRAAEEKSSAKETVSQGERPLTLDEGELLFNDVPDVSFTESGEEGSKEAADNSRCYVCHLNFSGEELSLTHAKAGVGCQDCHGSSDAHCGDEDNVTPPDRMYPRDTINSSCMSCHKNLAETEKMKEAHQDVVSGKAKEVCTDCHGKHRLKVRTRRWDRRTGRLIRDDKVRMIRREVK